MVKRIAAMVTSILLVMTIMGKADARSNYTPWSTGGHCESAPCQTHDDFIVAQVDDQIEVDIACGTQDPDNGIWLHAYRADGTVFWSIHPQNIGISQNTHISGPVGTAQQFELKFAASNGTDKFLDNCDWTVYFGPITT